MDHARSSALAEESGGVVPVHALAWKSRFVVRLAELFAQGGVDTNTALADAHAHAEHCYEHGKYEEPEEKAEKIYRELNVDSF